MVPIDNADANDFGAEKKKKIVSIGLVQTNASDDLADNMKKAIEKIKEASMRGAQIVCLQELYRTKYFPQEEKRDVSQLAETIPGDSTRAFSKLAMEKKIVIIAPLFEKGSNG
jgi:predicted amidohydrolase